MLEKFLKHPESFNYSDFPVSIRQRLLTIDNDTKIDELSIRLIFKVRYSETDNIETLSEFMLDLDPSRRHVNILFECQLDQNKIVSDQPENLQARKKFIENKLGGKYLKVVLYAFDDSEYSEKEPAPYYLFKRNQLEKKEPKDLHSLLNFQVIHARRDVASSEDGSKNAKPLATISTKFFKEQNIISDKNLSIDDTKNKDANAVRKENLKKIGDLLAKTDRILDSQYDDVFGGFLGKAQNFLEIDKLKVVSNIQSQTLIENSSKVIYGDTDNFLPENYNGLGYLNILYLLLQIEMCKEKFSLRSAALNLLIIEEPEAHTHPQMQYIFADKVQNLISEIENLQAVLTTHSSHIVAKSKFEDIRYLHKNDIGGAITIKNFHTDLERKYNEIGSEGEGFFKFLKQYLSINSAELFFASKAIFIEGTTEKMLLPWFVNQYDQEHCVIHKKTAGLSSQNITVLEVGANAKVFAPFLEFIGIKTLIITDIDTTTPCTNSKTGKLSYRAHKVEGSSHTSNESIKKFLDAPSIENKNNFAEWHKKLLENKLPPVYKTIKVAYQTKEVNYHARSFEDAFIALNIDKLNSHKDTIHGLKNKRYLEVKNRINIYDLTEKILDKKSDFAASILFHALSKNSIEWEIPSYIKEGLKWLHKD